MKKFGKPALLLLSLLPAGLLAAGFFQDRLGTNPIEAITHATGIWTLRFLVITLAISPIRWMTGQNSIIHYRRMIGLFAFFYGVLHFTTYLWLDQFFDWGAIIKDVAKRPFITAGFTALVLMTPLALTSTNGWVQRLGGKRWKMLHRLVYLSAIVGVIHFLWLVKADKREPMIYGAIVVALLGIRIWRSRRIP